MIKSQDDLNPCNDGHRSSDVLVATIEKCARLEAKNKRLCQLLIDCKEAYQIYIPLFAMLKNDEAVKSASEMVNNISEAINDNI